MSKGLRRTASYLAGLNPEGYGIAAPLVGAVNFLLDSYWAKIDDRAARAAAAQEYIPSDPDSHIRELWLGCEIHTCVNLNRSYPAFAKSRNAWGFSRLLKQYAGPQAPYNVVPFVDSYQFKEAVKRSFRIQYEPMNISLSEVATLPVFGTFFVTSDLNDAKLVVNVDFCYNMPGCGVTVMAHPSNQAAAEKFLLDLDSSIMTNDIYFKKCLSFVQGHIDFSAIKPTSWEDVVLKEDVKQEIRVNTIGLLDNMEQLAKLGMCPNRNVLLVSPPGMAKTTMFRATSQEVEGKATRIWCTGKSIQYPEHVTALFEAARSLAPCLVFIEDMDLFGGDRGMIGRNSYVLNEFLAVLDGTQANSGIVVLASTNDMASMDEALVNRPGRFGVKVKIPLPDDQDRAKMLSKFFGQLSATHDETVTKETLANVLGLTDGLTGDYIKELANATVLAAVAAGKASDNAVTYGADDLIRAAQKVSRDYALGSIARKHDVKLDGNVQMKDL